MAIWIRREVQPSVVYREGPITVEDYDEAIEALQDAREQLVSGFVGGCMVCHDNGGHLADTCHHNPLVLARKAGCTIYKCFHCGEEFRDEVSAERHFGLRDRSVAACLMRRYWQPKGKRRRSRRK